MCVLVFLSFRYCVHDVTGLLLVYNILGFILRSHNFWTLVSNVAAFRKSCEISGFLEF